MTGQLGLFGPVYAQGPDDPRPLPDEDLEATGYQDIDAQTAEILAIEQDLERRSSPAELKRNPNPHKGRQAKCPTCRECYTWKGRRPVREAYCPACGTKLEATTYLNKWPWNEGVEPLSAVEAWAKFDKGR